MNRWIVAAAICIIILSIAVGYSFLPISRDLATKRLDAVNYLKGHFNETLGLLFESEDPGTHLANGTTYRCNQTFFLYSDNLLAVWALKPYDLEMSDKINQSIASYNQPNSNFFEVLFGGPVPANMSCENKLPAWFDSDSLVIVEFHNSTTPLAWQNYGDTLIYQSLNCFLAGNESGANYYFYEAYNMWDGKGIYDDSVNPPNPPNDYVPHYSNYKLALVLYASEVLNIPIANYGQIEAKLWSMQQQNGGITSWADLNGNPIGTANTETTAIALLPYNNQLLTLMRSHARD